MIIMLREVLQLVFSKTENKEFLSFNNKKQLQISQIFHLHLYNFQQIMKL